MSGEILGRGVASIQLALPMRLLQRIRTIEHEKEIQTIVVEISSAMNAAELIARLIEKPKDKYLERLQQLGSKTTKSE